MMKTVRFLCVMVGLGWLTVCFSTVQAETLTWVGGTTGTWGNAASWNPNVLPAGNDVVLSSGKVTYDSSSKPTSVTLGGDFVFTASNLRLSRSDGSAATPATIFTMTGGTLDLLSMMIFGDGGTHLRSSISGGTVNQGKAEATAVAMGGSSTLSISQASVSVPTYVFVPTLTVGIRGGTGEVEMSGGTLQVYGQKSWVGGGYPGLLIGSPSDNATGKGNGRFTLSSGVVNVLPQLAEGDGDTTNKAMVYVGCDLNGSYDANGTLLISGGELNSKQGVSLAVGSATSTATATSTLTLSGDGILRAGTVTVGDGTVTTHWDGGTLIADEYAGNFVNSGTTVAPETWSFTEGNNGVYQLDSIYGTMAVEGNYTQTAGVLSLDLELDEDGRLLQNDLFSVNGDANISGGSLFLNTESALETGVTTIPLNDVLNVTGLAGLDFDTILTRNDIGWWQWSVRGSNLVVTGDASTLPEPATWTLLLLGFGMFLRRRKGTQR